MTNRRIIEVKKLRWGWSVDGRWRPTLGLMHREVRAVRSRTGKQHVRTPG
jgi:hypothetical protein